MRCIRPRAPFDETARGLKFDPTRMTASTSSEASPCRAAAARIRPRYGAAVFAATDSSGGDEGCDATAGRGCGDSTFLTDRKSTRLNSSHSQISYAVFCLKKKKNKGRLSAS